MLDYEDARAERDLYVEWLVRTWAVGHLADRVGGLLREGGYVVSEGFRGGLERLAAVDLADFVAANAPFETDDRLWLDHCRRRYPPSPHPSETWIQRNGGRVSWRDQP